MPAVAECRLVEEHGSFAMKGVSEFKNVYLHRGFVDFRKSINGLSQIVESEMELDLFSSALFVFCSKTRDKVKVLYWDQSGFALWYKRLEKEKFKWPKKLNKEVVELTSQELSFLLDGYDILKMKPHETLNYDCVS